MSPRKRCEDSWAAEMVFGHKACRSALGYHQGSVCVQWQPRRGLPRPDLSTLCALRSTEEDGEL